MTAPECPHTWTGTHPTTRCVTCGLALGDYWLDPPPEEPEEPEE